MKKIIVVFILIFSVSQIFAQNDNPTQKKIRWLEGEWNGTGYQIDAQTWQVNFAHADKKFSISYPSLGCSGWWKIVKKGKGRAEFVENLTIIAGCDQGSKVVVTLIDSKNIGVAWFLPDTFGDKAIAYAVLYKK